MNRELVEILHGFNRTFSEMYERIIEDRPKKNMGIIFMGK